MRKLTNGEKNRIEEINGTLNNRKEYFETISEIIGGSYNNFKGGSTGRNNEIHLEDGTEVDITIRKNKIKDVRFRNEKENLFKIYKF